MIIEPVFEEHFNEFDVVRADKISVPGRIDAQVISHLLESELVIADLTALNPNAFYEIGIRHTVQKPIIHMHLEGQRIPFDIASFRSIKFEKKRPRDLRQAREALKEAVAIAIDPEYEIDNSVTFSRGKIEVSENATPAEKLYLDQLDLIHFRLETLETSQHIAVGGPVTRRYWATHSAIPEPAFKVAVSNKNTAPDADLEGKMSEILRVLPGAFYSPSGRTHGILHLPNVESESKLLKFLRQRLGEDFIISPWPAGDKF
ncbi:hypothetical protein [Peteryoungia algae]|uniref:Uncharacterized protein n=1 Tax=Peteryoungia algae TaxID=2919917 RepID=A0ABT0D2J5_9HYPH|nr:hypothetical protein [Rhizobium sp. SSM4.3]MCJ8239634.1 hypothetical protein [Rhizobium sp. SSM4.3]